MQGMCVCVSWSLVKGVQVVKHGIPIANLAPVDIHHSIPWDSVVLPFGTPVDNSHGGVLKGVPSRPCILVIGLCCHSLGAVPQPRLLSPYFGSHAVVSNTTNTTTKY
jgi:hypothetical protein